MDERPSSDRRRHTRHPLSMPVQLYHLASRKEFPARSVDVSVGGMLVYVPIETPVAAGQAIRVTISPTGRPELDELTDGPIEATIVRVDRHRMVQLGYLPVGVKFTALVS